jgi:hypothetical protein
MTGLQSLCAYGRTDGEVLGCQKIKQIKKMREKTNTVAYKLIRQKLRIFCPEVNMCISVLYKTETQARIINIG